MALAPSDPRKLIEFAYENPTSATEQARRLLEQPGADVRDRCHAWWAIGLSQRELGQAELAADALQTALGLAGELCDDSLVARITTTLAWVRSQLGEPHAALALLDDAEQLAAGIDLAHLLLQRSLILQFQERLTEAIAPVETAIALFSQDGELLGEARGHLNLGVIHALLHRPESSLRHSERARDLADELGQTFLAAQAQHNVGYACYRAGEIARALAEMAEAEDRLEPLDDVDVVLATVRTDRAQVLMHANLHAEACVEAERAVVGMSAGTNSLGRAEATLVAAQCQLAIGRLDAASRTSAEAGDLLVASGRMSWLPLAELVRVKASEPGTLGVDAEEAARIAEALIGERWRNEAIQAALLAADLLVRAGDHRRADEILGKCAAVPVGLTAVERAGTALARARRCELRGDLRGARAAVTRGLKTLTENIAAIGAIELRAHAMAHGDALAAVGARLAAQARRPRELIRRAETLRGVLGGAPPTHPHEDAKMAGLVADLRALSSDIRDAAGQPEAQREMMVRRQHVERELRRRSLAISGSADSARGDVDGAIRELGGARAIEFVEVGEELLGLDVHHNRVGMRSVGESDGLRLEIESLHQVLHRLSRSGLSTASRDLALETLSVGAELLQSRLLPSGLLNSDPASCPRIVIVPTGRLHGLPWTALPALRGVPVVVAPSILSWSWARRGPTAQSASTVLIAGPDLASSDREVELLGSVAEGAVRIAAAESKVERCLDALERSDVAHFACHGVFRADNPMFSSLRLVDGDLTVYDLERCERLPHTIVMSACNAGQNAVLSDGALLGMASAFIQLGVSSVIAPLAPVNDERSVDLMVRLHEALAAGVEPAEAMAKASIGPDGRLDPAAAAFVCFGS